MKFYSYEEMKLDLQNYQIEKPDAIVAISRGGMTLAHHLAEIFNIKDVYTINASSYDKTTKLSTPKVWNIPNLEQYQNILVVDDVSDSGETFLEVIKKLKEKYPAKNFKSISIFYKPTSKFKPDFYFHETNEWIEFFWEKY
jgi:xanthine phosphoribosyltransferase